MKIVERFPWTAADALAGLLRFVRSTNEAAVQPGSGPRGEVEADGGGYFAAVARVTELVCPDPGSCEPCRGCDGPSNTEFPCAKCSGPRRTPGTDPSYFSGPSVLQYIFK